MQLRHVAGYLKDNMTKVKEAHMQAFPFIEPEKDDNIKAYHSGMTMRDEFAKAAMQGMFASDTKGWNEEGDWHSRAEAAYAMADAMLVEREEC
jgi:hypothetical protein